MPAAVPDFEVELSPVARQLGVTYLHDVDLDVGVELAVGDDVRLRDEGGALWDATVAAVEKVRVGRKYRLLLRVRADRDAPTGGG
jgi:hypothetical protein